MDGRADSDKPTFTYISGRTSLKHAGSYCELTLLGETETYIKRKMLGKGSFGQVSLMYNQDANEKMLAVKEIILPRKFDSYHDGVTQITAFYEKWKKNLKIEAKFCKRINGFGCFYSTEEPIKLSYENGGVVLTSYPQYYLATNYIPGVVLTDFPIQSGTEFLRICIQTLHAVHEIHKKNIVHCDIHAQNIIVDTNQVNLIDFSFSRTVGTTLSLTDFNLNMDIKPPEYKGKVEIVVAFDQDVYELGCLFTLLVEAFKQVISSAIKYEVGGVANAMMAFVPQQRISIEACIERFEAIEIKILKKELLDQVEQQVMRFVDDFPSSMAIDKWCYCCKLASDLNKKTLDVGNTKQVESDFLILQNKRWQEGFGATLLLENRINLKDLLNCLPLDKRKYLLQHLGKIDPFYLVNIPSIKPLILTLPDHDQSELLLFVFMAKKTYLEATFDQDESVIGKWCFCLSIAEKIKLGEIDLEQLWDDWRKFNFEKHRDFNPVFEGDIKKLKRSIDGLIDNKNIIHLLRYLGGECLENTLKNSNDIVSVYQLIPAADRMEFMRMFSSEHLLVLQDVATFSDIDLVSYVVEATAILGDANTSLWLEGVCRSLLKKYNNNFKDVAELVDKFYQPDNSKLYKQFLLALNNVYYLKRFADKRDSFTVFSRFSKQTKLNSSEKLAQQASGVAVLFTDDENKAAEEGDLGAIGKRLRKML